MPVEMVGLCDVSQRQWWLRLWKSTTLLGIPSDFLTQMAQWHLFVVELGSTFLIMLNATSASSCCLTSSFQWTGIKAGV